MQVICFSFVLVVHSIPCFSLLRKSSNSINPEPDPLQLARDSVKTTSSVVFSTDYDGDNPQLISPTMDGRWIIPHKNNGSDIFPLREHFDVDGIPETSRSGDRIMKEFSQPNLFSSPSPASKPEPNIEGAASPKASKTYLPQKSVPWVSPLPYIPPLGLQVPSGFEMPFNKSIFDSLNINPGKFNIKPGEFNMQKLSIPSTGNPFSGMNAKNLSLPDLGLKVPQLFKNLTLSWPLLQLPNIKMDFSFPFFNTSLDLLSSYNIQIPHEKISTVLDSICLRDYTKSCPVGWKEVNECQCISSKEYEGPCPKLINMCGSTEEQRKETASTCHVFWPCHRDECSMGGTRDYTKPCPAEWIFIPGEGCFPEFPKVYKGNCVVKKYPMNNYSVVEKQMFSKTCNVSWPCTKQPCRRNYNVSCPVKYRLDSETNVCKGDASLKNCKETPLVNNTVAWSLKEKQNWASKCNVDWPCLNDTLCEMDFDSICPIGWTPIPDSDGVCKMPAGFDKSIFLGSNDCLLNIQNGSYVFKTMSSTEKKGLVKKCGIMWPCIGNPIFRKGICPIGFHTKLDEVTLNVCCESDIKREKSECHKTRCFQDLTELQQKTLAILCNFQWDHSTSRTVGREVYMNTHLTQGADTGREAIQTIG